MVAISARHAQVLAELLSVELVPHLGAFVLVRVEGVVVALLGVVAFAVHYDDGIFGVFDNDGAFHLGAVARLARFAGAVDAGPVAHTEVDEVLAGKAPGAANELLSKLHEATKWPSEQAVLRTRALYPARPASASTASI